ncbi:MAG: hypothetical protein KDD58_07760 [Bdellovibrionales bacterium]|nr:hypothetical protein [Bdellovibrionales bacterium]
MQTQMFSHEELKNRYTSDTRISDVVADFEQQFWQNGSVICEIHLDGDYISEEDEKFLADKTVEDIKTLELLIRDQKELIEATLRTMYQWIPKLKDRSLQLSQKFKSENKNDSQEDFIELIDGCQWLSESLFLMKSNLFRYVNSDSFEKRWNKTEQLFGVTAKEVLNAFEKEDSVLISDILEYDLCGSLDQWQDLLFSDSNIRSLAKV